jgi:UDP-GlcNAc:undecaprenyl-phosphate GlcNAc-1-phosphate transferase
VKDITGWQYAGIFVGSLALTLLLTPMALRYALHQGALDRPSEIKAQPSPVPYFGGLAITVAFTAVVLGAAVVHPPVGRLHQLVAILLTALVLAVMGLVDDLRGLGPYVRLAVEALAGVVVWRFAEPITLVDVTFVDLALTMLWVVAVTNAFNMLDNMDGLSAGTASIAAVTIFAIAASNGQFLVATLAIALAGCAAGFLRSNFHPARIYMGDAGSLFIGFLLAVLAVKLRFDAPTNVTFFVPVLALGVPLFDMVLVTVNRLVHGRNPLSGGRDHTSHRLVFVGIPVPYSVTLIYTGAASLGILAVVVAQIDPGPAYLVVGWVASLAAVVGVLLSQVPVYDTSTRRHLMIQEVRRHEPEPAPERGTDEVA